MGERGSSGGGRGRKVSLSLSLSPSLLSFRSAFTSLRISPLSFCSWPGERICAAIRISFLLFSCSRAGLRSGNWRGGATRGLNRGARRFGTPEASFEILIHSDQCSLSPLLPFLPFALSIRKLSLLERTNRTGIGLIRGSEIFFADVAGRTDRSNDKPLDAWSTRLSTKKKPRIRMFRR